MAFEKARSAGYLANHMARLFAHGLQDRIRSLGLTTGQFPALLELWSEDGLTQRELVERIDIEQATMANTLARMERDGLVTRRRHPLDARAQQIWLTDKAKALEGQATRAAAQQNAVALEGLTEAEHAAFLGLMLRVIGNLKRRETG